MRLNNIQLKRAVSVILFLVLLSAVGMTKSFTQSFTVGDLNYNINDDGVTVTVTGHVDGTAATGELVIPETVTYNESTYSVTAIGSGAFYNCYGFTGNLVIPNSVTSIGSYAFYYCFGFTGNLTIGSSVTTIGNYAFRDCTGFTGNLVIPNSVTAIGAYAFYECTGFTGNLVIPNSVLVIGDGAFAVCTGFTGILVIPNSVTTIGSVAFSNCYGFTGNLVIPNSVTTIGEWTFYNCTGFTGNLVIPNSVNTISAYAFRNCTNFSSVEYNATDCADLSSGSPFLDCGGTLIIGENVEHIPARMFSNAAFTGSLIIPNSVTTIGEWTFYNCTGFTGNLVIPNSVNTISAYAFRNCTNFSSVEYNATDCADLSSGSPFLDCGGTLTIGENVERIPANMFEDAAFTGSLIIPNSVTSIGSYAFYNCTGFSSIEFNATNCADASGCCQFQNCGGTLTIGENVERIPAHMFEYVAFTGRLIIPNSVTIIGNYAFYGCTGFTGNLVIPNSVTKIGDNAFGGCTGFSSVEYNATNCTDASSSWPPFRYCGVTLTIGENVERIPANMFKWAAFTGSLIIPNSVTSIGEWAFHGCTGFTGDLVIPNSVTTIGEAAFRNCTNFSSVEYNATDCADLSSGSPFLDCGGTLIIGENVEHIPARMFSNTAFTLILSYAEIPPTVGICAFYGIDHDIPVYVPCGSLSDYQNADGWKEFNNIFECFEVKEITAAVTPANSGTVTGAGTYEIGTTCTLTAIANEGWSFYSWTEDGDGVSNNPEYSFMVTSNRNLVANFVVEGSLCSLTIEMYDSYGDGWNGGKLTVSDDFGGYSKVTLSGGSSGSTTLLVPDGSHITLGWINGDYDSECSFNVRYANGNLIYHGENMSSDFSFEFDMDCPATMFTITATANPIEGGTVIGAGTYNHGATATLMTAANTNYTFINWTKNGTIVSAYPTYSFIVTEDASYVANFELNSYTITATANPVEGGIVTGAGIYNHGAMATLTATTNTGYTFINWTKNGTVVSTEQTYSFTVTEDASYVANFELNSYTITATANPIEGGTIIGAGTYTHGATVTLTANANTGYTFINWTNNGTAVSTNPTYSFTVTEDASYVANFELNRYTITATANPIEGGTIEGAGPYDEGSTCTLTAIPNTGYEFTNWTNNGTAVSTNPTYSFTVTEDASYVANFELNRYTITATANPIEGGTIEGAGPYDEGSTCTLTAIPNTGYEFTNWTKNGTVVSAEQTYSFTVTEDVDLVANFKLPGDANGDGTVNALDVVIIVNHIFGLPTEKFVFDNADVNGDGVVDALDIVIIVNIIFSKNS